MSHLNASKLFSVEGKVVIVTGGGSGIGRLMTHALDANGASKIFIIGRRLEPLQETATTSTNGSQTIIPVQGDISSKESLEAAYKTIAAQTDHVDILIANSGIIGKESRPPPPKPDGTQPTLSEVRESLWAVPKENFNEVFDVNVAGTYFTILAFLPLLEAANKQRPAPVKGKLAAPTAQVIVTTSIAGFMRKVPWNTAYNLSKAATNHLVRMFSTILCDYDIRVNGIAPGVFLSEMSAPYFGDDKKISDGSFPKELIPLTRAGADEDMAGLILYMTGAAGGYLNGHIAVVDGGRLVHVPATL
ncbi:short chain dehydrogenase/reductase family [Aspergillus avenaceus]|uniref:Short chain dehydrogenase/reductase family n=1 Tax=Aspergillus avenaceus TaxID=36643 RepID=A0A5N6TRI0_ASPAV|nr:short chain dehydrogenase/reductase family [Aspergillus avenaceus]